MDLESYGFGRIWVSEVKLLHFAHTLPLPAVRVLIILMLLGALGRRGCGQSVRCVLGANTRDRS